MIDSLASKIDKEDKRQALWRKQREDRGFDDTELWNLDVTFCKFIVPRLRAFKKWEDDTGYGQILDEMIEGFQILIEEEGVIYEQELQEKVNKAKEHFKDYLQQLWN